MNVVPALPLRAASAHEGILVTLAAVIVLAHGEPRCVPADKFRPEQPSPTILGAGAKPAVRYTDSSYRFAADRVKIRLFARMF